MDTNIDIKSIINYVRDDSLFPNVNEVVFNERQMREAIEMACIEFGNKLWMYHPYVNHKFQNPETGNTFTVEEIFNCADDE